MSIPTTVLALYPFLMFFLQAAEEPVSDKPESVEVRVYPAGEVTIQRILSTEQQGQPAKATQKLMREAIKLLPPGPSPVETKWLTGPNEDFPAKKAKEIVATAEPAIQKLEQAVGGGPVAWDSPPATRDLQSYRTLAKVVALKARLQVFDGEYEAAAKTIGTGYALARALAEPGTELIHGLVGVAIGSIMTDQLLTLSQQLDAPSLLPAVRAMPDPLVDIEPALKAEMDGLRIKVPNPVTRKVMAEQLGPVHARARELARRLQGQIAAVRVIEELRVKSAGSRELPGKMDVALPTSRSADQISIRYKRLEPGKAELTVSAGDSEEQMRYEIELGGTPGR